MQDKPIPVFIIAALLMIGSGFFNAIGGDIWILVSTIFTESETQQSISFNPNNLIGYGLGFAGVLLLTWAIYERQKSKNREKSSPEEKLNDLINEVKKFIKKWNRGLPLLSKGYRQEILDGDIWDSEPEKILGHSIFFKRQIAQVKELRIRNSSTILNSLTDTSNELAKLGNDIENTVLTKRLEDEALKKDPELFKKFVERGDKICSDLKTKIYELETLRSHVL